MAKEAKLPINKGLSKEEQIGFYRDMVRIRRFEERSLRVYQQGKIGGFLHLYIGQESIAVACASLMGDHDHMITAYRNHGHALAVGMNMNECMAELLGKATGCSKGKGGSMHFFAPDKNYWGGHGIVGGQIPLGVGLAYGVKYKGQTGSAMAFMGDGAINQGAVHEAYNLAALWDLPAIFIIENNGYSMGTSQERSSSHPAEGLAARAEGYGMAWENINGESLFAIRDGVGRAIKRAHEESKPTVLEIHTYRYQGHSVADANAKKYRTKEEIDDYRKNHDPLNVYRLYLLDQKIMSEDEMKEIDSEAKQEAEVAAQFADESEFPTAESITEDVYWEADNPDQRTSEGRLFFND
ncbi:pyruvate dehydrogenase (acetyl-transferring) E1 component subunit alpha [Pelagicoccus sp. SDUM812005]|uniref:pyruvate dehydrogenase (acetyl-transferring) E1 component subunit alpha n=1 Tax=Pelagicoccus sp. SDUM812005 TaxID=3041257 RepID=UPI0031BB07FD